MPRTTIYDVARAASVSAATVSRVLNHPEQVSLASRSRVLTAIDDLGFTPVAEAVARARAGQRRIGLIGPFSSHPAARRRLAGALAEAAGDLETVVFDHPSVESTPSPLMSTLPITGQLDGLAVVSLPLEPTTAARLRDRRHPTVLVDVAHDEFCSIQTDDERGGELVAAHLAALGHQRFAYLGEAQTAPHRLSPSGWRERGFRAGLRDRGLTLRTGDLRQVPAGVDGAVVAARGLLERPRRPTAIFASDDLRAAGVLRAAAELGIRVPRDLSVVGFDDGELAEALALSTVHQPLEESGALAVRLLRDQMAGERTVSRVMARVHLMARETTGPAPRRQPE